MDEYGPYKVHQFADQFPLVEGEHFDELVADIKRNGLRDPIMLAADQAVLVDGRNRYRACMAAGVDPVFETLPAFYTEPMILDLIVSKNIERRQLNPGQRAAMALEYERFYGEAAREAQGQRGVAKPHSMSTSVVADRPQRSEPTAADSPAKCTPEPPQFQPPRAPRSRDKAAKITGASGRSVQRAKAVQRDAPDLYQKVKSGETALDAAYTQARQRARLTPKPEPVARNSTMLTLRTHDGTEVLYPRPQASAKFNETRGEGISWAKWSWNPVTGCLHGCNYCYARELATKDSYKSAYPVGFTPLFHHERLDAPLNTSIPAAHRGDPAWRRVFVCSMADLYGRWVPDEWIARVHESMSAAPWWEYLLLTKFPSRYIDLDLPKNAWVGTSVDEQKRVRIAEDAFRKVGDVKVKWLSLEPLREPLEFTDLSMFDWVVIGAQTETRQPSKVEPAFAPPFEWVARIVIQAREAGCKIHMKPNLLGRTDPGSPGMELLNEYPIDDPRWEYDAGVAAS